MPPRSDIEAMDQSTILYVIYRMVSAQQTNLVHETVEHFQNDAIFHPGVYSSYKGLLMVNHWKLCITA